MLLVNAIYFKGLWRYPFNESYTREGTFQVTPSHSVTVPFMSMERDLYWSESVELDSITLRLPYMVSHGQSASLSGNVRALGEIPGSHGGENENVFCDVAPWRLIETYQRFSGASCLHYQGDRSKHL
jgi:serpin B